MFELYALLLMASGAALIFVGGTFAGQSMLARIANFLFGVGFFGYGFYLMFLFDGGEYRIFFYAFILPVLLIVSAVKARNAAKQEVLQRASAENAPTAPPPATPATP